METEGIRKHHEGTKVYQERFHGDRRDRRDKESIRNHHHEGTKVYFMVTREISWRQKG